MLTGRERWGDRYEKKLTMDVNAYNILDDRIYIG
jgi:hypothetical protein